MGIREQKLDYLRQWAGHLQRAIGEGRFGKARQQIAVRPVPGPRAGGLDIYPYEDPAGLKKALNDGSGIATAHTVPWPFSEGGINVYSHGKLLRVEAPWPATLAENRIPLSSIGQTIVAKRHGGDRWVSGTDDNGMVVSPGFQLAPHWLFAGATGEGKTVAITSAIGQLAKETFTNKVQFVLIDGKMGEGLAVLNNIRGMVGPMTYDIPGATAALRWVVGEMNRRYETVRGMTTVEREQWDENCTRLVVVIDEIQVLTQDAVITRMIALLLQQGRAAKINMMLSTQHPTNTILGDSSIKPNLGGRVALKVNSFDASRVVLGQTEPDATKLLGKGDAYVLANNKFVRTQIAFMTPAELAKLDRSQPLMAEWPAEEPDLGGSGDLTGGNTGGSGRSFTAEQIGESILAAESEWGRNRFQRRLEEIEQPERSTGRAVKLLQLGRDINDYITVRRAGEDLT